MSDLLDDEARADIQGLALSGYGHLPDAAYLFLQFTESAGARHWLSALLPSITTAARWPTAEDGRLLKSRSAMNVAFTASGLRALGIDDALVHTSAPEFQEGAAHPERSRVLGDTAASAPEHWEIGGPATPVVHAMLIAHAPTEGALDELVEWLRLGMAGSGGAVVEIDAAIQRGGIPAGHYEPFGFRDGMGQPAVRGLKGHGVPTGEFVLGYRNHYGIIAPGPVVPADADPHGLLPALANPHHAHGRWRDFGKHGTYLVYRKLQQDVGAFWRFMAREAVRWSATPDVRTVVWLASRCVGRWPGGSPLVLAPDAHDNALKDNNAFLYASSDPHGLACPLGAHIRRTNPRDDLKPYPPAQSLSMSEAHRLLRHGRVYGPPLFDPALLHAPDSSVARALLEVEDDGVPRGLHFVCVNASIASQFEFVQQAWCHGPHFMGLQDNPDPLVGEPDQRDRPMHLQVPRSPGGLERTAALPRFVTVRGAAYLFMPGVSALRYLGAGRK